jgi:hypothetical protein
VHLEVRSILGILGQMAHRIFERNCSPLNCTSSLCSQDGWEAEVAFHVGGAPHHADGGGMAFWLTESNGRGGPVHGQPEDFKGIGVVFDVRSSEVGNKVCPSLCVKTQCLGRG